MEKTSPPSGLPASKVSSNTDEVSSKTDARNRFRYLTQQIKTRLHIWCIGVGSPRRWLRRLYDSVLQWAESPYGEWALFFMAVSESSFFPIAPDVLLIALAVAVPQRSFRYALTCTCGSVLGGMLGYLIGLKFMDLMGFPLIRFYGLMDRYESVKELFHRYDALAVAVAGFTPIPYKVFTIASGAFRIDFATFVMASLAMRTRRRAMYLGSAPPSSMRTSQYRAASGSLPRTLLCRAEMVS